MRRAGPLIPVLSGVRWFALGALLLAAHSAQVHHPRSATPRALLRPGSRFGVAQRTRLRDKSCPSPHVLYMTATPIPRTSALVLHGDMSQVVISEMPPGRTKVATHALLDSAGERHKVQREGGCLPACWSAAAWEEGGKSGLPCRRSWYVRPGTALLRGAGAGLFSCLALVELACTTGLLFSLPQPLGPLPNLIGALPCPNPRTKQVYEHMQREIAEGGQVYIICPLVEESSAEVGAACVGWCGWAGWAGGGRGVL